MEVIEPSLPCRATCVVLRASARLLAFGVEPVLTSSRTRRPVVAVTIDDGPDPSTTPALLEVLARHEAHATFFLIGERAVQEEALLQAVSSAGHELSNHLWQDQPSVRLGHGPLVAQFARVDAVLRPYGEVSVFRPGPGWFTPSMLRAGAQLGHRCVLGSPWLVVTKCSGQPAITGRRIASRAHPGAIVVLHEGTRERSCMSAVADALLGHLRDRGLRAVSVRELLTPEVPR